MRNLNSYKTGALSLLWLVSPWISLYGVQQIRVPLGCAWGDNKEKLNELIDTGGLTMVRSETTPATEKRIMTVSGVIGNALKQNVFIFKKNELVEIEYQYGDANWDAKKYQEFFDNFRQMFEKKYGPATQLTATAAPQSDPYGITTSITGYEWTQSFCILDLFYYTAEQQNRHYRLISVHYKMP